MKKSIKYKKGFKYQLHTDYHDIVEIKPFTPIFSDYIILGSNGNLTIKRGYAWDGCSGPTVDTRTNMRAGLVHDALSQLIREGALNKSEYKVANQIFLRMLKEDGMWRWRRALYFRGVSTKFATKIATGKPKKIHTAP